MAARKKQIPDTAILETASVADAKLDVSFTKDYSFRSEQIAPVPNQMHQVQAVESSEVLEGPTTLLEELLVVDEKLESHQTIIEERREDIAIVNSEHNKKLRELAQLHLGSIYWEVKQELINAAHRRMKNVSVRSFTYPLGAYDSEVLSGLTRMLTADAIRVYEMMNGNYELHLYASWE